VLAVTIAKAKEGHSKRAPRSPWPMALGAVAKVAVDQSTSKGKGKAKAKVPFFFIFIILILILIF
jgi:predicted RNA-binding protein with TRAM domain